VTVTPSLRRPNSRRGAALAVVEPGGEVERHPHLRARLPERRELKRGRHDTDDHVLLPVQRYRAADDGAVAAETPLPQAVTEHHDLVISGFVLASSKRPTHDRGHAEEIEQIGRHLETRYPLGPLSARQRRTPGLRGTQPLERPCVPSVVEVVRR